MTDGGPEFDNAEEREFCESRGIKLHIVPAYSLWISGLVEGMNKILFGCVPLTWTRVNMTRWMCRRIGQLTWTRRFAILTSGSSRSEVFAERTVVSVCESATARRVLANCGKCSPPKRGFRKESCRQLLWTTSLHSQRRNEFTRGSEASGRGIGISRGKSRWRGFREG